MKLSFINYLFKSVKSQDACVTTRCNIDILSREDVDDDRETKETKKWGQFIDIEKQKMYRIQVPYIQGNLYNIPVRIPSYEDNYGQGKIKERLSSRKSISSFDVLHNYSIESTYSSFNSDDSDFKSKKVPQLSLIQIITVYGIHALSSWYQCARFAFVSPVSTLPLRSSDILDLIGAVINQKTVHYLIFSALIASGVIIVCV